MFSFNTVQAEEDIIVYPFDEIVINSAFHFQVIVTEPVTSESFLFGLVDFDDKLEVYVGYLDFYAGGGTPSLPITLYKFIV
jgi:hypothetical protein